MRTLSVALFSFVLAVVFILFCPRQASADVLYSYTYNDGFYDYAEGGGIAGSPGDPYAGTHLTITLDFLAPLSPTPLAPFGPPAYGLLEPTNVPLAPAYWSINDGVNQYSSTTCEMASSCTDTFDIAIDSSGDVAGWNIQISIQNPSPGISGVGLNSGFAAGCQITGCGDLFDSVGFTPSQGRSWDAESGHNAGFAPWVNGTTSSVPEPTSLILVLSGLAGFIGLYRFGH